MELDDAVLTGIDGDEQPGATAGLWTRHRLLDRRVGAAVRQDPGPSLRSTGENPRHINLFYTFFICSCS